MKKENIRKLVLAAVAVSFVAYCFLLLIRLFVQGRYYMSFLDRFRSANFIPFKTIYGYAYRLANDSINVSTVLYNIFGNLIAFFPMGCYLPCLLQRMRGIKAFAVTVLGMLVAIETLQMLLGVGFFDIDDIILNAAGAIAGYGVVRVPFIQRFLKRIYVYQE